MSVLTISRKYGSGGREIGQAVAKAQQYEYVDKDKMLIHIRASWPKWEQWARDLDEHCPTVWEKYDWSFRGFSALIQSVILNYALKDNVVIMGRGGNFLLRDIQHALRIRVEAPMDARIERIMKREGLDKDTARWLCEKTDSERSCFIHAVYGKRWDDPAEYDKVFAMSGHVDEVVRAVHDALAEDRRKETEDARNLLRMLALAATVKAGIATNPRFFIPTLDVFYDGIDIVLRGVTHTLKEHRRIEDAAKELAGVTSVRCELQYRQ